MGCQDKERRAAAAQTDLDSSSSGQQQRGDLRLLNSDRRRTIPRIDYGADRKQLDDGLSCQNCGVANGQQARKGRLDVGGSADKEMAASKKDLRKEGKKNTKGKIEKTMDGGNENRRRSIRSSTGVHSAATVLGEKRKATIEGSRTSGNTIGEEQLRLRLWRPLMSGQERSKMGGGASSAEQVAAEKLVVLLLLGILAPLTSLRAIVGQLYCDIPLWCGLYIIRGAGAEGRMGGFGAQGSSLCSNARLCKYCRGCSPFGSITALDSRASALVALGRI
ncbi:hypothetical protein SASPL_123276 [Salvia splendens]|uniref:Uncharacterized protein n=1 Tax=Salvia splendens TaxID=180675 RepID=A0A8X8ZSU9_SALSN|nr:hypothetical protein SASPL_123276 [Salvia splendens]